MGQYCPNSFVDVAISPSYTYEPCVPFLGVWGYKRSKDFDTYAIVHTPSLQTAAMRVGSGDSSVVRAPDS